MTPSPASPSLEGVPPGAPAPEPVAGPMHGCVRCGARIPISESMCERCNPLGLKAPSATQAHGIAIAGVGVAVVIMAVVGRLLISGIGPFAWRLADVKAAAGGLEVTIEVTNEGSRAGGTTCRIGDPEIRGIGPETVFIETPVIQPGQTLSYSTVVASLGTTPRPLSVDCQG